MRARLFFCILILCSPGGQAAAEENGRSFDLTTTTCNEYVQAAGKNQKEEMLWLAAWVDGYLASISASTHINWTDVEKFSEEITVYCRKNGNSMLMDAARNAGIL